MTLGKWTNEKQRATDMACLIALLAVLSAGCGNSEQGKAESSARTSRIAFVSDRDGNDEVYVMQPDGSEVRNLTHNAARDADPCWSPDGKRIAFQSDRDGTEQIYVMNVDGTALTKLTAAPGEKAMPAWSHDGHQIAFCVTEESDIFIYVVSAEGGNPRRLTDGMAPSWSPDDRTIAFNRGQLPQIWLVDADGGSSRALVAGDESELTREEKIDLLFRLAPVWSPDGKRLLYTKVLTGPDRSKPSMNYEVFTMDLDGRARQRLTTDDARDMGHGWSPDGEKIVFSTVRDGDAEIYVMNADGSAQVNLTRHAARDQSATWSPFAAK